MDVYFFPLDFSATNIVTCKCHVDESTNSRYDMILGRDLLTALVLDIQFSDNIIIGKAGPYKGWLSLIVDISNFDFKYITGKTVKQEWSFVTSYVNECLKSNSTISSTCTSRRILDVKYKKADLNKVMTEQCQHLTATERHRLIHLLKKFKDMFNVTLGTHKTTPVYLESKDDSKPVC